MTTPLLMLTLMMAPYCIVRGASIFGFGRGKERWAACFGLALLFTFTGVGHFVQTHAMAAMLPSWAPEPVLLVYLTGFVEFAIALGFLWPATTRFTGWCALALLILFFPVNVYAALNHIPMGGHAWGPVYLLIRGPLQAIILFWVYWFAIRKRDAKPPS